MYSVIGSINRFFFLQKKYKSRNRSMTHPAFCQLNLLSKEILLLIFLSVKKVSTMPASISVIAYIAQQTIESINEYTIQKGLAYCRLLENHICKRYD